MPIEHDFGSVLSSGQTFRHDFILSNPTPRTVRLLGVTPLTPCCTGVEKYPDLVLPNTTAKISVVLRPASQTGPKHAVFEVSLADGRNPSKTLVLKANLLSNWDVLLLNPGDLTLPIGREGRQRISVTFHHEARDRVATFPEVQPTSSLKARLIGKTVEIESYQGLTQLHREIEVDIPASPDAGSHHGVVNLLAEDGQARSIAISWTVTPRLRVGPPALTLKSTDGATNRDFVVTSEKTSFRIVNVSGPILVETVHAPTESRRSHRLRLALDPLRVRGSVASEIEITTDDPIQPRLSVSVLILPNPGGASR